ncbi:MAG: hypothetical protein R3F19_03795 [Verrucomicrobiales bacterium]
MEAEDDPADRRIHKLFFVEMLGHEDWKVFSQIKTKDHDELPAVLSREQVHRLLHIRLRRYLSPMKLIYCCGLRLAGMPVTDYSRYLWR